MLQVFKSVSYVQTDKESGFQTTLCLLPSKSSFLELSLKFDHRYMPILSQLYKLSLVLFNKGDLSYKYHFLEPQCLHDFCNLLKMGPLEMGSGTAGLAIT